jgi:hypothetical protein
MKTLIVHLTYCDEHMENHWIDECGNCHGESLRAIESCGYSWPRHIGGGWYKLYARYPLAADLAWEMIAELHSQFVESSEDDF